MVLVRLIIPAPFVGVEDATDGRIRPRLRRGDSRRRFYARSLHWL